MFITVIPWIEGFNVQTVLSDGLKHGGCGHDIHQRPGNAEVAL